MKIDLDIDIWTAHLNAFRNCFYSRSFDLFVRYVTGLLLSENKTVDGMNAVFVEKTDQSNVNMLLTEHPWHKTDFVDELCMLFKQHRIPSSFSFFLIDDTLLEKVGRRIESAGFHYDHTKNSYVFGHQIATSGYVFKRNPTPPVKDWGIARSLRSLGRISENKNIPAEVPAKIHHQLKTGGIFLFNCLKPVYRNVQAFVQFHFWIPVQQLSCLRNIRLPSSRVTLP